MITTKARHSDVQEFARILKEQQHAKHDMVVPSHSVRMSGDGTFRVNDAPLPTEMEELLKSKGVDPSGEEDVARTDLPYKATNHAHGQLVSRLPIPAFKRPYDFLREDEPGKLSELINMYLDKIDKNLLVRTFRPEDEGSGERGLIRSFLSDRYNMMENFDIFFRALKTIKELGQDGGFRPDVRCNLSDRNMYVEFGIPDLGVHASDFVQDYANPHPNVDDGTREFGTGPHSRSDRVYPGFLIRNSEVGAGAFEVVPRLIIEICVNGIVRKKDALRKRHIGSQMESGFIQFSEDVRQKSLELADLQVKEAVEQFCSEEYIFQAIEDVMGDGADETLEHPREALSNACDEVGLTEEEEEEVLGFFHRGRSEKAAAIPNAMTAYAQHVDDPDRQFEIESEAWDVLSKMDRLDVSEEQLN